MFVSMWDAPRGVLTGYVAGCSRDGSNLSPGQCSRLRRDCSQCVAF